MMSLFDLIYIVGTWMMTYVKLVSSDVDDDFVIVKTMPTSSIFYKDNRALRDKTLS